MQRTKHPVTWRKVAVTLLFVLAGIIYDLRQGK